MFVLPLFAGSNLVMSGWVKSTLDQHLLAGAGVLPADSVWIMLLFSLIVAMAMDLGIFVGHLMQHRIPVLWEFHKVHHSAEVLNPLTLYRMHPVDNLLTIGLSGLLVGCANGIYQYLAGGEGLVLNILGVNLFVFLFYLMAYNLRHSHIWLSYGPVLSQVLISPAQHQIHHSKEMRHRDKNLGLIFAFWDKIAGTLYVPKEKESFRLGIDEEEGHRLDSVLKFYWLPFTRARRLFSAGMAGQSRQLGTLAMFAGVLSSFLLVNSSFTSTLPEVSREVYLEELTWQEVKQATAAGYTTVIIPTGGTEQNGPHMQLGKHNQVVHYTAGRIAVGLGQTLVAPVIPYVPEGNIEPASGHMRFAGTLSVPEDVFAATLEHTARSLRAHGFTLICFLGDSGDSQTAQDAVARRLDTAWRGSGFRVLQVDDYYARNGQVSFLRNAGRAAEEIGSHAGVRDTSELLAVHTEGVRQDKLADNRDSDFMSTGANGNSALATADTGEQMLRLKIEAGINQIRRIREH
jgi:sterol desaturase/sphingolipid hydroxylase (fatty acid hydroxylase superfamily)/creatinine amidohydrolase/Fe(II)-dependent formamide hydrolase-like protein